MNKVLTRVYCSCGWVEWNEHDETLSNDEIAKIDSLKVKKHMKEVHNKDEDLIIEHISHQKIKLN